MKQFDEYPTWDNQTVPREVTLVAIKTWLRVLDTFGFLYIIEGAVALKIEYTSIGLI